MKRISEYVADFFYRRYGGGPRLNGKVADRKPPLWVSFLCALGPCSDPSPLLGHPLLPTLFLHIAFVLCCYLWVLCFILNHLITLAFKKIQLAWLQVLFKTWILLCLERAVHGVISKKAMVHLGLKKKKQKKTTTTLVCGGFYEVGCMK